MLSPKEVVSPPDRGRRWREGEQVGFCSTAASYRSLGQTVLGSGSSYGKPTERVSALRSHRFHRRCESEELGLESASER